MINQQDYANLCVSVSLTVPVMTPLDFYYTDPNLPPGHRVPNIVTKFEVRKK